MAKLFRHEDDSRAVQSVLGLIPEILQRVKSGHASAKNDICFAYKL